MAIEVDRDSVGAAWRPIQFANGVLLKDVASKAYFCAVVVLITEATANLAQTWFQQPRTTVLRQDHDRRLS